MKIKNTELYTIAEIAESNILDTKHRAGTDPDTLVWNRKQLLLRAIRENKLRAYKARYNVYLVRGDHLIEYLTNYGKSNIITKG